jgi:hypothetical protein
MRRASFSTLGLFVLLLLLPGLALAETWEQEQLEINGPADKRIDVVILGDGYTADQQSQLGSDARNLIDEVFGVTPFREYRNQYNFHLVHVVSNESGADFPSKNIYVDTALDATYEAYGIDRLLVVSEDKATAAAAQVDAVDFIFVLVNADTYGGSGGNIAVTSLNTEAPEILTHEVGHMLGDLADEYEDAYPGYPAGDWEPNVTYATERALIPWSVWIDAETPLPTPETNEYNNTIGIFEGARYQSAGIYRPKQNCRMRSLRQEFCPICSEALIASGYNMVSPSDAEGEEVALAAGESVELDAMPVQTSDNTVRVSWDLNDETVAPDSPTLPLSAACLGDGVHDLVATVADTSSRLRLDSVRLLAGEQLFWTVTVSGQGEADPDACDWPLAPDGDVEDGDVVDGDAIDGDMADGDVADGDVADGDVVDGDVPDGDAPDGDTPDGDVPDGDVPDGDVIWAIDGDLAEDGDEVMPADGGGCQTGDGASGLLLLGLLGVAVIYRNRRRLA